MHKCMKSWDQIYRVIETVSLRNLVETKPICKLCSLYLPRLPFHKVMDLPVEELSTNSEFCGVT